MPPGVIIPVLTYPNVTAAARWLCAAFGFAERLRIGEHRAQLVYNGASLVVASSPQPTAAEVSVMVRVENVDLHFANATRQGAKIIQPPTDFPYGERQYTVEDPAGYQWTFSQSIADVDPKEWGGILPGTDSK